MKGRTKLTGSRVGRSLALVLALLSIVFLLQVTPHGHTNGQNEAACRLCQVAHVGVTPALAVVSLALPLIAVGRVVPAVLDCEPESFLADSFSRAPPTFES